MHNTNNNLAVETANLNYSYAGGESILRDINLQIPTGAVFGFLGPNGAGKTTTLKLLLGLLKKQEGDIRILGQPMPGKRTSILQQTGALIETPSLYGHLTAKENLQVLQHIYACDKSRMDYVLKITGIANTGTKKVSKFSLGMKQRLAIAMSLLHKPRLLILDEPVNGLDPNGMLDVRELLQSINQDEGITILISSHLLAEIEKLVTHTAIIHKGRLQFQGTLQELMQKKQETARILIRTHNNEKALQLLENMQQKAVQQNEYLMLPNLPEHLLASAIKAFVQHDIAVYEVSPQQNDLEHIFMHLLREEPLNKIV